jgi:DNA adenine methylase
MLSIFRYPGGKSKVRSRILSLAPDTYAEYREPFVGGGGVFFGVPPIPRWINDKHSGVVAVYRALRDRPEEFIEQCRAIPTAIECFPGTGKGRGHAFHADELERRFSEYVVSESENEALRYFVLQRCSLMGRVIYGDPQRTWFSAPEGWNVVNGDRLERAAEALQRVKITEGDFEPLLRSPGKQVWIYADPPYIADTLGAERSGLYQHSFSLEDHERLADSVKSCGHKVLLSYDDDRHGIVRKLYKGFEIIAESLRYGGAASTKKKQGSELLIANYELTAPHVVAKIGTAGQRIAA